MAKLTTTSYAVLGLLGIRSWTTYELARQMERSLRNFWPRAESNLYAAAKTLVEEGLATATTEYVGRRPRVLYSITPKGRKAFAEWVPTPGGPPVLEFEALLKLFFAEHLTKEQMHANLRVMEEWSDRVRARGREIAEGYVDGDSPFMDRAPINRLIFSFVHDHALWIRDWARWAATEIDKWPDGVESAALELDVFERALREPEPAPRRRGASSRRRATG